MAAALPENPEPRRPSSAKPDADAASESSSAHSSEPSDRRDVDVLAQVLSTRSEEYRLLFRLPPDEVLLQDFNCALQENILLQGHMYLFIHHICFYSNIFGFETKKTISFHEITCVRKAKTVAIFPNAIEIVAGEKKYFFGSFLFRDEAYRLIIDGWVQHSGDTKASQDHQDTKLEASSQDDASAKSLPDDSSASNRTKNANVSEEFKSLPNDEVDRDVSIRLLEVQENGCQENANQSSSQNSFTWTIEDIDAPKVPEHFAIVAESKFPLIVEDFFSLFVSDHAVDFLKDFHRRCGDKGFQCTPWRRHEQFEYTRNVSFLHPVKVYLGAKFGHCQEIQKFHVYRNSHLLIETSQHIDNVPFGDYFHVEGIWDVVQDNNGENSCTVKVYSNVAFSKKTMFKGKIEQSTREECREVYATWMSIAHQILKEKNVGQSKGVPKQNTCTVQVNKSISGSPPMIEGSTENPTLNSIDLPRNTCEATNYNSGIDNHVKEKSVRFSPLMAIFGELWTTFLSYTKTQSLLALVLTVTFVVFILMQISIILLLTRDTEVHMVAQENCISDVGTYNMVNIEWLEKRFNYLKEEMLMVESRLERMRHEYALLKSHLQSLERLRTKSSLQIRNHGAPPKSDL